MPRKHSRLPGPLCCLGTGTNGTQSWHFPGLLRTSLQASKTKSRRSQKRDLEFTPDELLDEWEP
jgi:hypothetical protein